MTLSSALHLSRPSTWFAWHAHRVRPGARVLDVACGEGRHALAAAARGAAVTALDRDRAKVDSGRQLAAEQGLAIEWGLMNLEETWPELGVFDVVLVFNYLDRAQMPTIRARVAPGGVLIMETFLATQRHLGWGPTSLSHLLREGELARLAEPLDVVHGREVLEPLGTERWRAVASIIATRSEK